MNIQKLKYFISVAKHLNFTKAAEECYITQAAMSRQIATLEKELGFPLFIRKSHTIELTKAGSAFYSDAVFLYEYYVEAMKRNKSNHEQFADRITIGIGSYESVLIGPILSRFHERYPNINFKITEYSYPAISSAFENHDSDFFFCQNIHEKIAHKGNTIIHICESNWTIAVSAHSPMADLESITYEDLNDCTIVTMETLPFKEFRRNHMRMGFCPKDYVQANSFYSKVAAIEANLGVAFIPKLMESSLPDTVKLIPLENAPKDCGFFAAYPTNSQNNGVHLLARFLSEELRL